MPIDMPTDADLHATCYYRLYKADKWLCDPEECEALRLKFEKLRDGRVQVLEMFAGYWAVTDIPGILLEAHLITWDECQVITQKMPDDANDEESEPILRPVCQKAFMQWLGAGSA